MKVTVCQLNDDRAAFERDWATLGEHVRAERSELVLLPEMPFARWFARASRFDPAVWRAAVEAHDLGLERLPELGAAAVLGSRPSERDGRRLNEAFVWTREGGCRAAHEKAYLPEEEGYWEARWYERGDGRFVAVEVLGLRVGFAICSDLWFFQHARAYGRQGIHILACPRATPRSTLHKWEAGGQAAAVVAGAYCLSSNRFSPDADAAELGGRGWIVDPDGLVLGTTSPERPFLTVAIDPGLAEQAKSTYPRYVTD